MRRRPSGSCSGIDYPWVLEGSAFLAAPPLLLRSLAQRRLHGSIRGHALCVPAQSKASRPPCACSRRTRWRGLMFGS
eukprot:scaffold1190_cov393-Prasinococcus_capsulatus_cf.AAC.44